MMVRESLSAGGKLAKQYCEEFPTATTRGLAGKLWKEHPKCFPSWEACRSAIRVIRGENGDTHRKSCNVRVDADKSARLTIPKGDCGDIKPYILTAIGNGLLFADLHIPYHSSVAVERALTEAIDRKNTDFCIILGDFIDHYSLSSWSKDPEARRFKEERKDAMDMLTELKRLFKVVIYKGGNHEKRYDSYMRVKAPELIGVEEFEFEKIMHLEEIGVEWVKWNRVIYVGEHLTLLHGDEYPRGLTSPVNPARGMFLRASDCTVSAHQHQASTNNKPTIRGRNIANWSLGCLCGLHPEYAPLNFWNHGWALMKFDGHKFEIQNRKIINDEAVSA